MNKKAVLMILDGWGIAKDPSVSAIDKANTPFVDSLYHDYPNATLQASGLSVGLPDGQMGNSEVGHMNLGAGRVVYQDLVRINKAIEEGDLAQNTVLKNAVVYAEKNNKNIHLIGLVSDGGVHSHIKHLEGITDLLNNMYKGKTFVHAFTDGRDCDPKSGLKFIESLEDKFAGTNTALASVIGRYYAMDRDKRWERVKLAYDLMIHGKGEPYTSGAEAIRASYDQDVTDEFIMPKVMTKDGRPVGTIEEGDVVMCFNFRTDRGRQITTALTQQSFPEYDMQKLELYYLTMTVYDETYQGVHTLFDRNLPKNTLGEVLSNAGKKQIRIAETEKYPHVSFFFSGGEEQEFDGEKRIMIPSPKVATYDLQPEMSAYEVRDAIVAELKTGETDFVCLNFANPDMVGHTGVMEAAIKACETVDQCAKEVVEAGLANGYSFIILADHGNSDCLVNPDGSPNTAHTTQPVPWFFLDNELKPELKHGKLGDVAPTILKVMEVDAPEEMTGEVLFHE